MIFFEEMEVWKVLLFCLLFYFGGFVNGRITKGVMK